MSKYTTEVRYICESYANLEESVDYPSIDEVIENSYRKIFNVDKIPMFNGEEMSHRTGLLKKILLHYYSREIGYETVGLWKLKLNQKMIEIMPYYNQLYESELLEFYPLHNVDVTKTHTGEYEDDEKVDNLRETENHKGVHTEYENDTTTTKGIHVDEDVDTSISKITDTTNTKVTDGTKDATTDTTDSKATSTTSTQESDTKEDVILRHSKTTTQGNDVRTNDIVENGESWSLFSDTPQGGINGIANASNGSVSDNSYLTNATHNITTPDEQSVTQTHGDITETYNALADRKDNTEGHAEVNTQTGEIVNDTNKVVLDEDTHESQNEIGKITESEAGHTDVETQTRENTTKHDESDTKVTENANGKVTDDNAKNTKGTDSYTNHDIGKIGTETYSEMLNKFRSTFLNIDLMVIEELEPLFMGLW